MSASGGGEPNRELLAGVRSHRGMSVGERLRAPDSYGVLLVLIIVSMIVTAIADTTALGRSTVVILQGLVLIYALRTSRAGHRLIRSALLVVPPIVILGTILAVGESDVAQATVGAVTAVLALGSIAAVVRRIGSHPRVDAATILGALCTYLLIGLFFSAVFATIGALSSGDFFVNVHDPRSVDYMYFAFITLTTVGYGDFVAAGNLGRMIAATEALFGQLYLVTVVALVIGNIGRERRPRMADGPGDEDRRTGPGGSADGAGPDAGAV